MGGPFRANSENAGLFDSFQKILKERPFRPHPLLFNGHLQTLAASRLPRDFAWGWKQCRFEKVELRDGARVQLMVAEQCQSAPTLVLVHGMGGSSQSGYMMGLSHKAWRQGWNAVLLNLYNCNENLARPKIFHAGCSREVDEILAEIVVRQGFERLFLGGVSMGGNILLRLLGEWGETMPPEILGAAVMSPLVDLTRSWSILERPSNFIYRNYFVSRLRRLVLSHRERLEGLVDLEALAKTRTIRQFDEIVTAPLSGFQSAFHYYREASAFPHLSEIRVPTLILHSKDDPLLPWEPFSHHSLNRNPNILLHLTPHGGHVGFIEAHRGGDIDRRWAENRMIDFFRSLPLKRGQGVKGPRD